MSFSLKIDRRDAAYVRFVGDIYDMINKVVHARENEGVSRADIARRMGKDRSQLSRILNGHSRNITIRTIAEILYATNYEMDRPVVSPLDDRGCNHVDLKPASTSVAWTEFARPSAPGTLPGSASQKVGQPAWQPAAGQ